MRLTIVIAALLVTSVAHAYPQFQLSTGAERCGTCHISITGGGLLNDYGRDEAGSTISRGGDGRAFHGLVTPPAWFQLGLDLRGAALAKQRGSDREVIAFPMQTDLYLRTGGEHFGVTLVAGMRGGARDPQPPFAERIVSREHYASYETTRWHVRAGRFFPVFGLRSQDHTVATRRYLGFHTLEEPYALAGGHLGDASETHVAAFVPRPVDLLGSGVKARGLAAYHERRILDGNAAIAGQSRLAVSAADVRVAAGVVGKRWLPGAELMVLAELDLQRQSFREHGGPTRYQLAGYVGASRFVIPGVMVGASLHRWQPDLRLVSARDAAQLDVQYFPRAHFELHLLARIAGSGTYDDPASLAMLQLHYYL